MKKKSLIGWGKNFIWFKAFRAFPWYFSCVLVAQPCLTSRTVARHRISVHRIRQARILQWIAISFSRGSSQPRDGKLVSCIAGRFFYDLSYGNCSYYPPKEHNGGKLSKGRLRQLRESKWRIQVKARSTGAVSQAPPRKAFCLPSLPTIGKKKIKVSRINKEEMELKLQKTGKGIVNENCVWEVKPEGGTVQREGREHSSTWPLLPLADLRGWGWGGGVGMPERVKHLITQTLSSFLTTCFSYLSYHHPNEGKKKRSRYIDKDVLQAST